MRRSIIFLILPACFALTACTSAELASVEPEQAILAPAVPAPIEPVSAPAEVTPTKATPAEVAPTKPVPAETAKELLLKADRARGNLDGVRWTVLLESHEKGRLSSRAYEVTAKHFDFLARAVEPSRLRGNKLLMKQGSMWFHKTALSKPMPVSRRQKLAGGAAYGDIAATNYAEDYEVKSERTEERAGRLCRVLELEGKTKKLTYDQVVCWIDVERAVNVYAEYYSVSGKKLKTAEMSYENKLDDTSAFISEMTIRDELMGSNYTVMTFSDPALMNVSDRLLTVQNMKD